MTSSLAKVEAFPGELEGSPLDEVSIIWYFDDILGHINGPYSVRELGDLYKDYVITASTHIYSNNSTNALKLTRDIEMTKKYLTKLSFSQWNINGDITSHNSSFSVAINIRDRYYNAFTKIKRIEESELFWREMQELPLYDEWRKSCVVKEREAIGYFVQDSSAFFIHNLCYYAFAINLYFQSTKYENSRENGWAINDWENVSNWKNISGITWLAYFALVICALETMIISLGIFELKERMISFSKYITPLAVIHLVFEFLVNIPMLFIDVYYLYYANSNGIDIHFTVYLSFVAYFTFGMYKIFVIGIYYSEELNDFTDGDTLLICGCMHACNWAICMSAILLSFGCYFFIGEEDHQSFQYILSLALIVLGCVSCCCVSIIGLFWFKEL